MIISTFPAGLGGTFEQGNNAVNWTNQPSNSFTVSGGIITAASFQAGSNDGTDLLCINNQVSSCDGNFLTLDNFSTSIANPNGFAGVTFTPIPFNSKGTTGLLVLLSTYLLYYGIQKYRTRIKVNSTADQITDI